jgi:GMP reductase
VKIEPGRKFDFNDVLIRPRPSTLSSRRDVDITRTFDFCHSSTTWTGFPLIASNMDATGTMKMAGSLSKQGALTALSKFYAVKELVKFFRKRESEHAFYSMGMTPTDYEKLEAVKVESPISKICIEVANGYIQDLPKYVTKVRKSNPTAIIMAGSVCTPEITKILLSAGADIIRVGIGSGSVCITRKMTGVGCPQLSAILECSDAAHQEKGLICSDGGCTVPGDICKAFGAGADFVMLGGMLAGHDECDGVVKFRRKSGRRVPVTMEFYGMASIVAQKKHFGGISDYCSAEGKVVDVPYRGGVTGTLQEIAGGLRSMMTYIDAKELAEVPTKTSFMIVGSQLNQVYGQ